MIIREGDVYSEATPIDLLERAFRQWSYPWQIAITRPVAATPAASGHSASGPGSSGSSGWIARFNTRDNRDIWGQDIRTSAGKLGIRDSNIDDCAKQCSLSDTCVGFAFDRWGKTCYPKRKVSESILDAKSMIAIKKPAELPNVSRGQSFMEPASSVRVRGQLANSQNAANFAACETACYDNLHCVAFNFLKSATTGDNCEMYKMSDGYEADSSVDGGIKYQRH
jgi:hypothetical protein